MQETVYPPTRTAPAIPARVNKSATMDTGCAQQLSRTKLTAGQIAELNAYDFMAHLGKQIINPGGKTGRDQMLAALVIPPTARLLEIGCGTGVNACYIARTYGCNVTAVDISTSMVERARNVIRSAHLENNVLCHYADINDLPFVDNEFDFIICQAVLMFVDQPAALTEVRRVLKPSGQFAAVEFNWRVIPLPALRDSTYRICGCHTLKFHSSAGWLDLFKANGFNHTELIQQPFRMLRIAGFLRDEGFNSLKILARALARWANLKRMMQIWRHFSRHQDYIGYVILSGRKP
ncbi:MAG: methyltransferase domain-containing protein [Gammaproteobacteria bacterium]|nr:methyltransferase domain-containing protein [Gammaproteobacteria bacterium]